ncbi:MAG: 4-hydroxy-tetrahydrodipicolinate synthase [Clostridiales bacterium]|jgi:4-hydroxy-tetrahydrodipicolinate synthase|nr:4-hydroxy-tetrahydrodipicolinate synthase [Clostridiales bacterium]
MKEKIFEGSGVAIVTPFKGNEINYEKFEELIEFQLKNNTDAIIVCGTTGEASTLSLDEQKNLIEFAVKKTNGKIPIIAGTSSNNTNYAITLSKQAEKAGANGVLITPPYYNKTTQKGLYYHIETISKKIKIPIILYNIPSRTGGFGFNIETLKKLSQLSNVNSIKEATGDLAFLAHIASETDLILYAGNDDIVVPAMSIGSAGVISVVANILPLKMHEICKNYISGNILDSREEFLKMFGLIKTLFIEVNPIPIKTAMNILGMDVGNFRMPLCEMETKNLEKLKKSMKRCGFKIHEDKIG